MVAYFDVQIMVNTQVMVHLQTLNKQISFAFNDSSMSDITSYSARVTAVGHCRTPESYQSMEMMFQPGVYFDLITTLVV